MPLTVKTGAMKVKDPSTGNYVDVDMSLGVDYAPINSPAFSGTPTAPTATASTNNTQIATTAFAQELVSAEASARQAADSALQGSLNTILPLDTTPTSGSTKGVTSGGVKNAIDSVENVLNPQANYIVPTNIQRCTVDGGGYIRIGNIVIINIRIIINAANPTISPFPKPIQNNKNTVGFCGYDGANEKVAFGYLSPDGRLVIPSAYGSTGTILVSTVYITVD